MSLTQGSLRKIKLEETVANMVNTERVIDCPAFQYIGQNTMTMELQEFERREQEKTGLRAVRIRYRTKNHLLEEKEGLTIAGEIDTAKDIHDLGILLRDGKVKEFYAIANKLMMIKRNNPVVSKVKRDTPDGDIEILEDRAPVDVAIAKYFASIYKRP